jgi:hypothetical protein
MVWAMNEDHAIVVFVACVGVNCLVSIHYNDGTPNDAVAKVIDGMMYVEALMAACCECHLVDWFHESDLGVAT